jgi:signal transduction histidine kinase
MWTIYEDSDGVFWIGSENGLHRFEMGRFFSFNTQHGLPESVVNHVLEDDDGFLWLSGLKGIYRVSKSLLNRVALGGKERLDYLALGQADGMLSPETNGENGNSACKSKDGKLWFPTGQGVVVIDPKSFLAEESPPTVVIEELRVDNHIILGDGIPNPVIDLGEESRTSNGQNPEPGTLRFAPGEGNIVEVGYTANSFVTPAKVRFKYRLLGQGTNWFEVGARRGAIFTNLRPGSYHFEVTACNSHGVWQPMPASFSFLIEPHFYQTWLFYLLCGATVICAGAAVQAWRLGVQRRIMGLEKQHALEQEREKIARDMHDDLGAELTHIKLLGEIATRELNQPENAKAHLRKLQTTAARVTRNLDEMVWAINPGRNSLEDLAVYLGHYAEELFEGKETRCRMDLQTSLPELSLTAETRHNLFFIVKELLSNVLQHAGASEVWLRLSYQAGKLTIVVEDNGTGMDSIPREVKRRGDGLSNVHARVHQLGGSVSWGNPAGKGVKAEIVVALI